MSDEIVQRSGQTGKFTDAGKVVDDVHKKSKRSPVQDLWEDQALQHKSKAARGKASLSKNRAVKRKPHQRLKRVLPTAVLQSFDRLQIICACGLELLLWAAAITTSAYFAYREFFNGFDVLNATHWAAIQRMYQSGQSIPWAFAVGTVITGFIFLFGATKIFKLNLSDNKEHAKQVFKPIMLPFIMIYNISITMLETIVDAGFRIHKPVQHVRRFQNARKKKRERFSKPDPDASPDEGTVSTGGGQVNQHSSFQSGVKDPAFQSSAQNTKGK